MGAPLGFKTFTTGDVLTAADTNGYLMQGVWTFASATARDAAVTSPQEGNMCYLKDTDAVQYYSGSAWTAVGATPSFVGATVYIDNANVAYTSGVATLITPTTSEFDSNSFWSSGTNPSRFTIPSGKAGKYLININHRTTDAIPSYIQFSIYKNGSAITGTGMASGVFSATKNTGSNTLGVSASILVNAAAGDYFQVYQQSDISTANHITYYRWSISYEGA